MLRFETVRAAMLHFVHARFFYSSAYFLVMSFLRTKTIKGKTYLYRQTSVRKGKKVKSKMEYLGALGWIALAAVSPGKPGGYKGHASTDKRTLKHQDAADRERFKKEMENPKERFQREAAKTAALVAQREAAQPKQEPIDAIREFNEARAAEKGPLNG
jgi:hypothetical protein